MILLCLERVPKLPGSLWEVVLEVPDDIPLRAFHATRRREWYELRNVPRRAV